MPTPYDLGHRRAVRIEFVAPQRRAARSSLGFAIAAWAWALTSNVDAQDIAAAEALFNKGATEFNAGHYDVACPALDESYRIDPRPGALFTLAECQNKRGAIATAVARYEEFLRLAAGLPSPQRDRQAERVLIASQQKERLTPDVPTLTLRLGSTLGPATSITRDGTAVGAASLDVPIPVDPGEHRVVFVPQAGGSHEIVLRIARGERRVVELQAEPVIPTQPGPTVPPAPSIPVAPAPLAPPAKAEPTPPAAPTPSATVTPARDDLPQTSPRRIIAYAVGGVGVAAVTVGTVAGVLALARKRTVEEECVEHICSAAGLDAVDQGRTFAAVSTATLVVGSAAVAGGALLFLTAPSSNGAATRSVSLLPWFDTNGVQLHVGGHW